jgi:hypothetical protein
MKNGFLFFMDNCNTEMWKFGLVSTHSGHLQCSRSSIGLMTLHSAIEDCQVICGQEESAHTLVLIVLTVKTVKMQKLKFDNFRT